MLAFLMLWACQEADKNNQTDSGEFERPEEDDTGSSGSDDTSNPDDNPFVEMEGSISGTIDIQLYALGEDGERESISWAEAYSGVFPFGKIFVGAYYEDPVSGDYKYVGYDIIENPQPSGNAYSIDLAMTESQELRVFGVLDYYIDDITGTDEPIGGYNRSIIFEDGLSESNVNFSILSPLHEERPPCDNGRSIEITGEANITGTYNGGDVAVMLMKPGNIGPIHHTVTTPEVLGGGASGAYRIEACEASGYMILKGIWDYNLNGMFDPMDRYGPYVSQPNESGNPISIAYSNLANYEIQIPLGDGSGLKLVPFVNLLGSIRPASGTFDELAPQGTLYVAALKYRPNGELSVATVENNSYDIQVFQPSDLVGQSSVDWKLTVPSETIAYLWAYIDVESNGMLNEAGEPIASGGQDDNGKFPTGSQSTENINMILATME